MASGGGTDGVLAVQVDEIYEFCAPKFFDFMSKESDQAVRTAELWFETSRSYAPSPFMPRIKEGSRSIKIDTICDFGNMENTNKEEVAAGTGSQVIESTVEEKLSSTQEEAKLEELEADKRKSSFSFIPYIKPCSTKIFSEQEKSSVNSSGSVPTVVVDNSSIKAEVSSCGVSVPSSPDPLSTAEAVCLQKTHKSPAKVAVTASSRSHAGTEVFTPKVQVKPEKGVPPSSSSRNVAAKSKGNMVKQSSVSKSSKAKISTVEDSKAKKKNNVVKCGSAANRAMAAQIAQENQAIKRQKLDDGKSRQILNVKARVLPHKSRLGLASGVDVPSSGIKGVHEDKMSQKEVAPFISAAEMVNKFQSRTRDLSLDLFQNRSLSQEDTAATILKRPKLTLTRPKEPELGTAHRVRAVRIKSSAELEEEMLAKIPKFKARPLNKKILEAPTLPSLQRTAPQPPQFQEFHFKTMERAHQHSETSSVADTTSTFTLNQDKPCKLTEPKPPRLETSLRARPPKVKSTQELELEELEKIPKFKARPLNKKILESKGDIGLFINPKAQITTPKEFHFATDDRLGPPVAVEELFDKLSIHSKSSNQEKNEIPRITIPNPFHLHTEERGLEKERQLAEHISQKQQEEEMARIPKANPYPYTTDYPVIPPKPEPKHCTKPEAFQLESLVRHEEEMQRKLEEKQRMEREEAQRRIFRAQPILKEDPIPLPERERKPLTEVQEFVLHVDHRAVERSEFDKKIKEKEATYKRMREEEEHAKMIEEEKAVKQMRRTMVPHARPLPKFENPFLPQKSTKGTTKPKSPELRVNQRAERRHVHMR